MALLDLPVHNAAITDDDNALLREFVTLLEKSKVLFNELRDLPTVGNRIWQYHFGRTFGLFTKLWHFQYQYRELLDRHLSFRRWQIGELASKIGQLYYHYYLRTSETSHLMEAFAFYSAIRNRAYYSNANKENRPDLMVKQLRYYARFIVVCLLLKKMKLVRDLIKELQRFVDEYVHIYEPADHVEWKIVLTEIKSFIEADNVMNIVDIDSSSVVLSNRLTQYNIPPLEKNIPISISLQQAIIVGGIENQAKYSEMTLDMYWMLQVLEREPTDDFAMLKSIESSPIPQPALFDDLKAKYENARKFLLYKPTIGQLLQYMSIAFNNLHQQGGMLLYLSCDGSFPVSPPMVEGSADQAYEFGGVSMNSRLSDLNNTANYNNKIIYAATTGNLADTFIADTNCLYAGDLYPYLRKPLFIVVDSSNSSVFLNIPSLFGQPRVVLTGPEELPPYLADFNFTEAKRGSLFTMFLHSPLTAFCYICNYVDIPIALWDKCQAHIDRFFVEAGRLLVTSQNVDRSYREFYGDEFLRLLLLRFIFCHHVLRLHHRFRHNPAFHPHCHPPLPEFEVLDNPTLCRSVLDLALILDALAVFRDQDETIC